MKNLFYEKKLKLAEEALESGSYDKETIEYIFPELKDNDERIKREVIKYIKTGTYHKDWVEWLEKQGEKPQGKTALEVANEKKVDNQNYIKDEPKFHEGEWIVNKGHSYLIADIDYEQKRYLFEIGGYTHEQLNWEYIHCADSQFHLWTIEDAKDGDVLACNEEILLFKSYSVQGRISLYCWYNGQTNNFHSKEVDDVLVTTRNKIYPATKEQRDALLKAMADAGYEWDADKKELKKIEQEPENYKLQVMSEMADLVIDYIKKKPSELDEDDERLRKTSISFLKHYADKGYENAVECIDWLESIKDRVHSQSHWKPSEEQMDALEHFVRGIGESGHASPYDANLKLVHSLLNDLRKLNEE